MIYNTAQASTPHLQQPAKLHFADFFNLEEVQSIQDSFSLATGVPSFITTPDGLSITHPSNLTRLCRETRLQTGGEFRDCTRTCVRAVRNSGDHPVVQCCLTSGLLFAGIKISVAGTHVANWMIGQVRSPEITPDELAHKAELQGIDSGRYRAALSEVPVMAEDQLRKVAQALFVMANSLSGKAYDNARLAGTQRAKRKVEAIRRTLMDKASEGIAIIDHMDRIIDINTRFARTLDMSPADLVGARLWDCSMALSPEISSWIMDRPAEDTVFETRIKRRDGSERNIEISMSRAEFEDFSGALAICRDITERKALEATLRTSEERLRLALGALSAGVWEWDARTDRHYHSQALQLVLTGDTPEEKAATWFELVTADRRYEALHTFHAAVQAGAPYYFEWKDKDRERWFNARAQPQFDAAGNLERYIGITRDISQRRMAEKLSRNLLQIVEQSPACIVMTDPDGTICYANPTCTEVTGYSFEEIKGRKPSILASGTTPPDVYRQLWATITAGRRWQGEFLNRRKDGSLFRERANIAPIFDPTGAITYFVAIKEDITQQRQAEEDLRKLDINFRNIVDTLPLLVSYIDPSLHYRFVNAAYARLFSGRTILNRPLQEVVGPSVFSEFRKMHPRVFAGETVHFSQYLDYGPEDKRYIDGHFIPDLSANGTVEGYFAVLHDLTELKQIGDSLRRAKDMAEAANRLKSEFLANMSHEIRTPLNGVMGMLQILQATDLDEEQQDYVHTALTSSGRLTRLLNDILDISKIEADRLEMHEQPFCVRDLRQGVMELFGQTIENKKLSFEFTISPALPEQLVGDEARLTQILFNLVGNSLKFTPSGTVSVHADIATGPRLLLMVHDTGVGMDAEIMTRIFEPFVQSDGSYTRQYQGIGLGLSIVRKLVLRMNGSLCMESAPDEGTCSIVSVPCRLAPGIGDMPSVVQEATDQTTTCTVLLVEDDDVNLLCATSLLAHLGHTVVPARNGVQALEQVLAHRIDIILMDIQMPVMDGVTAVRTLRTAPEYEAVSTTPVIAMTAHTMAGDREKFLASGMDGYLSKPLSIRSIKEEMSLVLA